jgi:hypothetical protein
MKMKEVGMAGKNGEGVLGGVVDDEFGDQEDDFFSGAPKKSEALKTVAPKVEVKVETPVEAPKVEVKKPGIKKPEAVKAAIKRAAEAEAEAKLEETPKAEALKVEPKAEPKFGLKAEVKTEPKVEPKIEVSVEAVTEPAPIVKPKRMKAVKPPKEAKPIKKPLSEREKVVAVMLKKAGLSAAPDFSTLLKCKLGQNVAIKDIAVFIGEQEDGVLAELAAAMPVRNRVNLTAEVDLKRVKEIGAQVMKAGRMYQPIQVASIAEDGRLECTSGRHRLVFLALVYGTDAEIPVYVEDMTMREARDAVVVANQARKAQAMEKVEHAVLQAVGGDVDVDADAMYDKTCTSKSNVKKYCAFSVLERGEPVKLGFPLLAEGQLKGGLTTVIGMEGFWGSALEWRKGMPRVEFDASLKEATEFLNTLVGKWTVDKSFEPRQHMSSMTLAAVAKYYRTLADAGFVLDDAAVSELASVVVAMGDIGRQTSDVTYAAIVKAMKKAK